MKDEHSSVKAMWNDYLSSIGEDAGRTGKTYTSWYFCDNEKDANELAGLVREGIKRGTTSLYDLYKKDGDELPLPDSYSVITDWSGIAKCIIRTKKVTILAFHDADKELAETEGEGDKSLNYWRQAHLHAFTRELKDYDMVFSENMLIVFEEFEVVYR